MNSYDKLLERVKEITLLGAAGGFLNWDMLTYMPPRGAQLRGEQLGVLTRILQRMQTSTEFSELLSRAEKESDSSDPIVARNLQLLRKNFDVATVLPEDLVAEISKQRAIANQTWVKAKTESDWKIFEPVLEKTFDLQYKAAELTMDVIGAKNHYDALIDNFEPGMTSDAISSSFSELRSGLVPLVKELTEKSSQVDVSRISRNVEKEVQKQIVTNLAETIGYDTTSEAAGGRIDDTVHPFTIGYYDDVRITVRYDENNVFSALSVLMHEAGHGIYEQSFNQEWKFQPIGAMAGLGIHESISRFYENMIGRSKEFWNYYLPRVNELSNGAYSDTSVDELLPIINQVRPSKIRVAADEVTYSLHVIIRFEIEKALFAGDIKISELPQVWNDKYSEYLGVNIENDAEGVLQDSHWSAGMFGYFPTYALGNLYNGMWYEKMSKDSPDWKSDVQNGNVKTAYGWLNENIMQKGAMYDPLDLIENVMGRKLSGKPFLTYLENKYNGIF
ncbi:MAG: carboxypeptidase M32 [Candidatus Thorarchaeota archaeon]|jgi:carboxypeptidase Taq